MKCKICDKEFKMITNTHLKKAHGIDTFEYKNKFGQDSLNDDTMRAKITASRYHVDRPECYRVGCSESVTNTWNKYCSYFCAAKERDYSFQTGEKNHQWNGGWFSLGKRNKSLARERDQFKCRKCTKKVSGKAAHVHHMIPERCFDDPKKAHALPNLVTLCSNCHLVLEWEVIKELHDRALKLDELLKDDPNHVSFEEYKNNLLPKFQPLPTKLRQDIADTAVKAHNKGNRKNITNNNEELLQSVQPMKRSMSAI